ncbi:methyltransferase domain-containing protein [Xylariaceae sp. FL0255]|nr:methyltransferase domain-containing protein [Xylariaceae sp. FL0255]
MEEEPENSQWKRSAPNGRRIQAPPSSEKIVQWLSPRSDHFPTPRGFHFMSAPILPDSPSTASFDESNSPSTSSNPWNRTSVSTDVTEFDDIYDVSDDEDRRQKVARNSSLKRRSSVRTKHSSGSSHRALPPLVIPTQQESNRESWSGRPVFNKLKSPVPLTPSAKVEMSPAVISFLQAQQAQDIPTISAPPSLDGSLNSDQLAVMSAPATPVIGSEDDVPPGDWSGVQLQPAALATLQALSGNDDAEEEYQSEQVLEIPEERSPEMTQQPTGLFSAMPRPALRLATSSRQTLNGLTRLDIPSPGGFFSGLSPRTRHTWHMPSMTPEDNAPPTSTTAEQFYRLPWQEAAPAMPAIPSTIPNFPPPPPRPAHFTTAMTLSAPVEQVVELRGTLSDGMPTARPIILEQVVEAVAANSDNPQTARRVPRSLLASPSAVPEPSSPNEGLVATEIVTVYDSEYAKKQQKEALSNLDRTELWLMAQKAYLQGVYPEEERESSLKEEQETVEIHLAEDVKEKETEKTSAVQKKKAVRFSEIVIQTNIPRTLPSKFARQESAYYRAFQDYIIRSRSQDTFVHRLPRFEALQAQRISLREAHRNQLLGKYQLSVVPQSARKRMSANVVRGDDVLVDDPERLKREKEDEALTQMAMANWHVSATKTLNGGRLFSAPIAKRLARLFRIGGALDRTRILDLGGQATCDWGWHCAITYPNTKIYTVTTKAIRQLSNSNMRGPPNHRQVAVEQLTRLPFPDAHFDLVSARELHSVLKFIGGNGEDEWETCLAEVMRVLKPGGYLDFSLLDSDIMNAGPLGLAKSVEFGFSLKTLGYDPNPTRMFLGRLARAGFTDVRRAWMCLPMGHSKRPAGEKPLPAIRDSTGVERPLALEAIVQGSTENAASIAGFVGGWSWERWLLRCEMEKVAGEGRLWLDAAEVREAGKCLDGVHGVIEEGRACGAGYRTLNGYASKPRN